MVELHLTLVDEAHEGLQHTELHTLEVEERMRVWIQEKNFPEERRVCSKDYLVCLQLLGAHTKSHVKELLVLHEVVEGQAEVILKVLPMNT